MTVNGDFVNDRDTNGVWWIGPQDLVPGTNTFAAAATDRAGWSVTNSIFVIYDTTFATNVPVFTVSVTNTVTFGATTAQFALGGTIDDSNAMMQVDVLDAVDNTITNASVSAAVGTTNWWAAVPVLSGTNLVRVTARNSASLPNSQSFTTIQDTSVFFEITSPAAGAAVNGTNVTVTGLASLSLSDATITVNGQPATITVGADNITFSSTSPVSLDAGGNVIDAEATGGGLGGQKLTAMQTVYGYELLALRSYKRYYGQSFPECNFQDFTDTWDTGQGGTRHVRADVYSCTGEPFTDEWDSPISFDCGLPQGDICLDWVGPDAVGDWWVYQDVGLSAGLIDTRLTVIKHAPADEEQVVVFHFDELEYFRLNDVFNTEYPRTSFDPSTIRFRGSPGFWDIDEDGQTNGVAFLIKIRTNSPFTILGSDFQFPSLPDVGWNGNGYCHRLAFRGFGNEQVKARIKWNGTDITDTTTNVIVGQRINLIAELQNWTGPTGNTNWFVPGKTVSNYVADASTGVVIPVVSFTDSSMNYCWVDGPASRTVASFVTLEPGLILAGTATFNVKRPQVQITAIVNSTGVTVDTNYHNAGWHLHFGRREDPGITFAAQGTNVVGFSGDFEWIQLVDTTRTRTFTNANIECLTGIGLDIEYPYPITAGHDGPIDAPGSPLTADLIGKSVDESFKMYLMYKPSGTDSIWVPLRVFQWGWNGEASLVSDQWIKDSGTFTTSLGDSDTTDHPEWDRNAFYLPWTTCP